VRRLFQTAVEIIKKKSPKASFVDFHGCGSFHKLPLPQLSFFFASFFFLYSFIEKLLKKFRVRIVYRRRSAPGLTPSMVGFLLFRSPAVRHRRRWEPND